MQQEPTDHERIVFLESKLADLERQFKQRNQVVDERDWAMLIRIDSFREEFKQANLENKRMFETLMTGQVELTKRMDNVENTLGVVVDTLSNHKVAIDALVAGQQQIIALLVGTSKQND